MALGEVATFTNGVAFKSSDWEDNGSRIIRIQNLTDAAKPFNRTTRQVPDRFHVHPGDLLVSWSATLGVFEWQGPDVALLNQHIFRVQPNSDLVDKRYLRHAIGAVLRKAERHMHGATMRHVNKSDLLAESFSCPPLEEQAKAADVLDAVDALRVKRRRALELFDELTRSVFLDMFGDPVRNPRGWEVRTLGDLLSGIDSGKSPQCLDRPARPGEWGVLKLGAVTRCVYDADENKALPLDFAVDQRFEVRAGDLLFSRKNTPDLVAAVALVTSTPERLLLPDLIFRLVPAEDSGATAEYLHAAMTHPAMRKRIQALASGSAASMVNISKGKLMGLSLPVPPLELQERFAALLRRVRTQRDVQTAHLATLDELFTSVQQRAFNGTLWDHEPASL
ncbi:restriction endonuclease subunit S [Streptomyces sp. NPDC052107]|uniref:restriction endonuclease subunit S n=1 Tax=Streptomyces sp. NPDC052107 TaxID=3155632 RepID=UPI003432478E